MIPNGDRATAAARSFMRIRFSLRMRFAVFFPVFPFCGAFRRIARDRPECPKNSECVSESFLTGVKLPYFCENPRVWRV